MISSTLQSSTSHSTSIVLVVIGRPFFIRCSVFADIPSLYISWYSVLFFFSNVRKNGSYEIIYRSSMHIIPCLIFWLCLIYWVYFKIMHGTKQSCSSVTFHSNSSAFLQFNMYFYGLHPIILRCNLFWSYRLPHPLPGAVAIHRG